MANSRVIITVAVGVSLLVWFLTSSDPTLGMLQYLRDQAGAQLALSSLPLDSLAGPSTQSARNRSRGDGPEARKQGTAPSSLTLLGPVGALGTVQLLGTVGTVKSVMAPGSASSAHRGGSPPGDASTSAGADSVTVLRATSEVAGRLTAAPGPTAHGFRGPLQGEGKGQPGKAGQAGADGRPGANGRADAQSQVGSGSQAGQADPASSFVATKVTTSQKLAVEASEQLQIMPSGDGSYDRPGKSSPAPARVLSPVPATVEAGEHARTPDAARVQEWYTKKKPGSGISSGAPTAKEEHHYLVRWDKKSFKRFGTPVTDTFELPFDASLDKQNLVDLRALNSTCAPASCPDFGGCQNIVGLSMEQCTATSHNGTLSVNSVIRLRDVFISGNGVVFNQTTTFDFDDCTLGKVKQFQSSHEHGKGVPVLRVKRVFSLVHHWGRNFFHNMMEVLPMFFALGAFLRDNPGTPIIMHENQYQQYCRYGKVAVGIDPTQLNIIFPSRSHVLLFAEELIQPHFPQCMKADTRMISKLREHYYLRRDGLPFLSKSFEPRFTSPIPESERKRVPEDWVVVLFLRPPRTGRGLVRPEETRQALIDAFGEKRLVEINGTTVLEAMGVFQRARLFLTVHGAALTNMVFMPEGAFVFEYRLSKYNVALYENMAEGVGLNYYSSVAEGAKWTYVTPNMTDVAAQLQGIKEEMEKQEKENPAIFREP